MPTLTTTVVLLVTGFCLFTAVYFLAVYFMMGRKYRDRLSFGLMALLGAGFAFSMLFQLKAPEIDTYRRSLLWYLGIFIPNFFIFLAFTSYYTGYESKRFMRAMGAATLLLWGVHWSRHFGLVTDGLHEFGTSLLPWGEPISLVRSTPSIWVWPFYAYLFIGLLYALRAGLFHVRQHRWLSGKGFLFSVGISFLAGANNLFVDLGYLRGPYISEAAVLAFILFMTLAVAAEWRDQDLFYGHVFDAQNDAIFVHDPDSGDVLQVNQTACSMFGGEPAKLLGQGLARLGEPESALGSSQLHDAIRESLARGTYTYEGQASRLDHSSIWVEVALRATPLMGRPRVIVVVRDVTERKRLEQERLRIEVGLQHAQRLESLGMMASSVAHDFNNILMAIQGNIDLIERREGRAQQEEGPLANVRQAVRRASDLCRQLLAYAGKGRVHPENFELGELVREVGKMVEVAAKKGVRWQYAIATHLPAAHGDATQIRQVVLNLLTNAADSLGPNGGVVRTSLSVMSNESTPADPDEASQYFRLEVGDNGCGMNQETQERIFEPFFSTKHTGRGLGLAAVQGILRGHGGSIRVQSQAGEGTTITVLLPASKVAPAGTLQASVINARSTRVLLVDDEAFVRKVTGRLLETFGFDVCEADGGHSAIAKFQEDPEHFVGAILDFSMPDLDGLETYSQLLAIRPNLPALITTGYGLEEFADKMATLAHLRVVLKPYSRDDLEQAITQMGWPINPQAGVS